LSKRTCQIHKANAYSIAAEVSSFQISACKCSGDH